MFTCSHTQAMNVVPSAKDTPQRPGYYMITNSTLQLHKTPGHNARAGSDQSKKGELRVRRERQRHLHVAPARTRHRSQLLIRLLRRLALPELLANEVRGAQHLL